MPHGSAAVTLPGAASSLSHWIMGIRRQLRYLPQLSETSPGLWNVAAAPGVAFSPSQGTGASRQPVMWVCTAPGLARGDQRVPVPVVSVGLLLQKEMGLGFFFSSFKIAAGDPLSSGKLVLERDY